jgi:hypothetical protein
MSSCFVKTSKYEMKRGVACRGREKKTKTCAGSKSDSSFHAL